MKGNEILIIIGAKRLEEKFIMNPQNMLSSNELIFRHFPRQISTAAVGEVEKLNCLHLNP